MLAKQTLFYEVIYKYSLAWKGLISENISLNSPEIVIEKTVIWGQMLLNKCLNAPDILRHSTEEE